MSVRRTIGQIFATLGNNHPGIRHWSNRDEPAESGGISGVILVMANT